MNDSARIAAELSRALDLAHPPVAVSFLDSGDAAGEAPDPQPAGCCFWALAETTRISTRPADHAHCSVGSYTHGLISLEQATAAEDVGALVASGWLTPADLEALPAINTPPVAVVYEPLAEAENLDVVLLRLTPASLATLQGACPEIELVSKPQCQIVPIAGEGRAAVSAGCAVSRVRAGLPAGELTCALPGGALPSVVERLNASAAADRAVAEFAAADIATNFAPAT